MRANANKMTGVQTHFFWLSEGSYSAKVFPTSLGLEAAVALAETSQKGLETVTVEATSTWLKEEVAQVEALQGLDVAVATKSVVLSISEEAAELVPEHTADGTAVQVVIGSVALLFPACLLVLSWRCAKRLAPRAVPPVELKLAELVEVCPDVHDIRRTSLMDDVDFRLSDVQELEADLPEALANKSAKRLVPKGRAKKKALAAALLADAGKRHKAKRLVPKQRKVKEQTELASGDASELNEIRIGFDMPPLSFSGFDDDNLLDPPECPPEPWLSDSDDSVSHSPTVVHPSPPEEEEVEKEEVKPAPPRPKRLKKRSLSKKKKEVRLSEEGIFEDWLEEEGAVVAAPSLPWEEEEVVDSTVNARAQASPRKDDPHETW